jgi:hypothetical protein
MEYCAIGEGETLIVHITGCGLIDSVAQVTPSQDERSDDRQQRAPTADARDLWYKPATVRHSP